MSSNTKYTLPSDLPMLPPDWEWKTLAQFIDDKRGIRYGIVQPGKHDDNGIQMVNSGDVIAKRKGKDIPFKVSKKLHEKYKRSTIQGGEVLLTLVGANFGKVMVAPESFQGMNCSRPVGILPVCEAPDFIKLCLESDLSKQYMNNWANTTAQPTLNLADVAKLPIPWPPKNVRENITNVVQPFDSKISLVEGINKTLEQIAQAIFKSWFVDFEPTKAKIAAREALLAENPAATPEQIATTEQQAAIQSIVSAGEIIPTEQLQTIADLFPNQLVDSELGEIPYGWEIKALDQIANYQNGLALQKFRPESGEDFLPVLKIAQLKAGFADGKEVAKASIKKECIVDNGDVIFSWSGSLVVDIWCGGRVALNQHLFKVTSNTYPKWFFYKWTKYHLEKFQQIAADKAVTMGHIKRSHLSEAKCLIPASELIKNKFISSLIDKQVQVRLESKVLSDVRDSLLPRLLAGEFSLAKVDSEHE